MSQEGSDQQKPLKESDFVSLRASPQQSRIEQSLKFATQDSYKQQTEIRESDFPDQESEKFEDESSIQGQFYSQKPSIQQPPPQSLSNQPYILINTDERKIQHSPRQSQTSPQFYSPQPEHLSLSQRSNNYVQEDRKNSAPQASEAYQSEYLLQSKNSAGNQYIPASSQQDFKRKLNYESSEEVDVMHAIKSLQEQSRQMRAQLALQSSQQGRRQNAPILHQQHSNRRRQVLPSSSESDVTESEEIDLLREEVLLYRKKYEDKAFQLQEHHSEIELFAKTIDKLQNENMQLRAKNEVYVEEISTLQYEIEGLKLKLRQDLLIHKAEKLLLAFEEVKQENKSLQLEKKSLEEKILLHSEKLAELQRDYNSYRSVIDDMCLQLRTKSVKTLKQEFDVLLSDNKRKTILFKNIREIMKKDKAIEQRFEFDITEKQMWAWLQNIFASYLDYRSWHSRESLLSDSLKQVLSVKLIEEIIPEVEKLIQKATIHDSIVKKLKRFLHIEESLWGEELERKVNVELARRIF